jgi:hypothetical protein
MYQMPTQPCLPSCLCWKCEHVALSLSMWLCQQSPASLLVP